ncbi:MAG: glycogen/starch/alpha-glucan phosphorylase, partial [Verrucomicrobiota bacterium]
MAPKTTRSATKKTKSPLDKNGHDVTGQPHLTAPGFKYNKDNSPEGLQVSMRNHLKFTLARDPETATMRDWWTSSALAARDRIMERFIKTMDVHNEANTKRVYYLSLEYLMGRLYKNNLYNSGLYQAMCEAAQLQDIDIHAMEREERDMGLGNGGLGRLAACFLDSLATLDLPAVGYGIRYEYGLFRQEFVNGYQIEHPDNWQQAGDPWEICRPEYTQKVRLYGRVEHRFNDKGDFSPEWVPAQVIEGVPYDIPICGYGAETVNFLRLWEAKASQEFDLQVFNRGDYVEAVREKAMSETVSKVLYPNDTSENGKELRLVQQYFFVCCSLHDIIRRFLKKNSDWRDFPSKCAIQLNDTHPAIAVPELMRIFIDEI